MRIPTFDDCDIEPSLHLREASCHTCPEPGQPGHCQVGHKGQSRVIKGAAPGEEEGKATGAEMPVTPGLFPDSQRAGGLAVLSIPEAFQSFPRNSC